MSRKIPSPVAMAGISTILVALGCWAYFGDTSIRQARRMRLAREFLPGITNVMASHPEFRDVTVGVGTGAGGCLLVVGMVETEKQKADLEQVIAGTRPPATVTYAIKVLQKDSGGKP